MERRLLKASIYELVKDKMSKNQFNNTLKTALQQESFRYDTITDAEINSILTWVRHKFLINRSFALMEVRCERQNMFLIVLLSFFDES